MFVTVEPKATEVLPIVAALFARNELGNVTATEVTLAFVYLPFVSVALLIVPPVITTALAFWVDIVPKPVTALLAMLIATLTTFVACP